jgi:hypothetical protein
MSIPPLPAHLCALVGKAARKELPDLTTAGLNTPAGTNFYVLAWCAAYVIKGDREHVISRLERVHELVEQSTASGRDQGEEERGETVYDVPKGKPKMCDCGAEIWFVKTPKGGTMPVTADGKSHFGTCPNAKEHSKTKPRKPRKTPERKAA